MKIELYMDVWPGRKDQSFIATDNPASKPPGCRRFKITAFVPDCALIGDVDGEAAVDHVQEVGADE